MCDEKRSERLIMLMSDGVQTHISFFFPPHKPTCSCCVLLNLLNLLFFCLISGRCRWLNTSLLWSQATCQSVTLKDCWHFQLSSNHRASLCLKGHNAETVPMETILIKAECQRVVAGWTLVLLMKLWWFTKLLSRSNLCYVVVKWLVTCLLVLDSSCTTVLIIVEYCFITIATDEKSRCSDFLFLSHAEVVTL